MLKKQANNKIKLPILTYHSILSQKEINSMRQFFVPPEKSSNILPLYLKVCLADRILNGAGLNFIVNENVLIPRNDTEIMIDSVLDLLHSENIS